MNEAPAPRQLIVLCDGTNNNLTGGRNDTNVVKLIELLARQPNPQRLVHYDPGVGNAGNMPGATIVDQWRRDWQRIEGLAFGRGVYENIAEAYIFLMRHWRQQGDRIFLFGFSRGAFTARAVAGIINRFGLLQPHLEVLVPTLVHHYFSDRDSKIPDKREQWEAISAQVLRLFSGGPWAGPNGQPNPYSRRVFVYFTGLWDTVASVGMWPFGLRITVRPSVEHKYFLHMRQALALDEHRAQFKQRLYLGDNNDRIPVAEGLNGTLKQMWFRGAHCDVGGYYAPGQTALPDQALAWLVGEAVQVGLSLAPAPLARDAAAEARGAPATAEHAVLQALHSTGLSVPKQAPMVHSELFDTPLWALAGMTQRHTQRVVLDDGTADPITPVAHPSVAAFDADARARTQWQMPRDKRLLAKMLLACLLLPLFLGWVLGSCPGKTGLVETAQCLLNNNARFQQWQLQGATLLIDSMAWGEWRRTLAGFASPIWALVWDFLYIAAYAYVLSYVATWAFARRAGLRQVNEPPSKLLCVLGWALPCMVLADVLENVFTWLAIVGTGHSLWLFQLGGGVLAAGMASASVLKWLALVAVVVLVLWGALAPRLRHRPAP